MPGRAQVAADRQILLPADFSVPSPRTRTALDDTAGAAEEGLNQLLDHRRPAHVSAGDREGRALAGDPALALQGFDQADSSPQT